MLDLTSSSVRKLRARVSLLEVILVLSSADYGHITNFPRFFEVHAGGLHFTTQNRFLGGFLLLSHQITGPRTRSEKEGSVFRVQFSGFAYL